MLGWLLAAAVVAEDAVEIRDLYLQVVGPNSSLLDKHLTVGENLSFALNENWTLSLDLTTTFLTQPKHQIVALESGVFSVSFLLNFKNGHLTYALAPLKLKKLYKHSGVYNLRIMISDRRLKAPLFWHVGTVEYETWGEVVDNFTDTEWDFEPPPKTPNQLLTRVFTGLMFVPFVILLMLLGINGINFGYFPTSPLDALISLAFVIGLAAFFAFFVHFWKYITFEKMCVYVLAFIVALAPFLRGALTGRAKMVARDDNPKND
jgi:hypothetical protein